MYGKSGRKVYQYFDEDGKKGKIVSRKQHLVDLQAQGKLSNVNVEKVDFQSKRKRSYSSDGLYATSGSSGESISTKFQRIDLQKVNVPLKSNSQLPHIRGLGLIEKEALESIDIESFVVDYASDLEVEDAGEHEVEKVRKVSERGGSRVNDTKDLEEDWEISMAVVSLSEENCQIQSGEKVQPQANVQVRNEIVKKTVAMKHLKVAPDMQPMKQVCIVIDQFRSSSKSGEKMDTELKRKLIEVLTNDECSVEQFCKLFAEAENVKDFFFEDLIQETLAFGAGENALKYFPPDLKENICLKIVEETQVFAPNLLNLVIKVCK